MLPTDELRFSLESWEPDTGAVKIGFQLKGWVAFDGDDCQLLLDICGRSESRQLNAPHTQTAGEPENGSGKLPLPLWFDVPIHLDKAEAMDGRVRLGILTGETRIWLYSLESDAYQPRGVLLGGSNSVIRGGLADGLASVLPAMKNLAVGTTSSLQNLFELLRNGTDIADMDYVITESNVNDSLMAGQLNDIESVIANIDWYYQELLCMGVPVYVLLLPLKRDGSARETPELMVRINERHRCNAARCGFQLIDLVDALASLGRADMDMLMADARHPQPVFMYELGGRLAAYIMDNRLKRGWHQQRETHSVWLLAEYEAQKVNRTNARFSEWLFPLSGELEIPARYRGKQLLGIACWPTEEVTVRVRNRTMCVDKVFGEIIALKEFPEAFWVDEQSVLAAIKKTGPASWMKRLFRMRVQDNTAGILGLIFRAPNAVLSLPAEQAAITITQVIPSPLCYIQSMRFCLRLRAAQKND